jgi:hypothetical protein
VRGEIPAIPDHAESAVSFYAIGHVLPRQIERNSIQERVMESPFTTGADNIENYFSSQTGA